MPVDLPGRVPAHLQTLFRDGAIGQLGDGLLLERFIRERDEVAFEVLVRRHGPMVLRVCRAALDDPNDVDDAFQAVFLVLLGRADSVRSRDSVASWLFGVASRVSARARADGIRRRRLERDAAGRKPEAGSTASEDHRADAVPALHDELVRLPDRYREALVLCYFEGQTCDEAARRLGRPVGTVKARLSRARGILKRRLMRRGFALPMALATIEAAAETASASAAVPMSLARETLLSVSRFAAGAAIPSSRVSLLAQGAIAAMAFVQKSMVAGVALVSLLVAGTLVAARTASIPPEQPAKAGTKTEPAPAAPAGEEAGDGLPTIEGTVVNPDGSPAVGATVEAMAGEREIPAAMRSDRDGRFRMRGLFRRGVQLRAASADGSDQAVSRIASGDVRKQSASRITLTLAPASRHVVTVVSAGHPVQGTRVVAIGTDFKILGVTDQAGRAELRIPEGAQLDGVVAWHPELGVDGVRRFERANMAQDSTRLSLREPAPFTIRVVDTEGKGVGGLELAAAFRTEDSDWIVVNEIDAARFRTGPDGTARVAWAPRDRLKYADVEIVGPGWKVDHTDTERMNARITKLQVRREHAVEGRVAMPEGASAEGIVITGFGFGTRNNGHIPFTRARRDGTFTLHVPSDHGFALGISDAEWASDLWTGVILGRDDWKPAEVVLKAYPATPLTIRATRGTEHTPVADAWIHLSGRANIDWVEAKGEKHSGHSGVRSWLKTDKHGLGRTALSKGKHEVRLSSGDWSEEKVIDITSDKPVEVTFHRAWTGERKVAGRLTIDGAPYRPSSGIVSRAWSEQRDLGLPLEYHPEVRPDGTFDVKFDAENVSLYFMDPDGNRAGFVRLEQDRNDLKVEMVGAASYEGILTDESGKPLPGRTLRVYVAASQYQAIAARGTDQVGRFHFPAMPANVPLRMHLMNEEEGRDERFLFDRDRLFMPGEARKGEKLTARPSGTSSSVKPPAPLAKGVENISRNARAAGMRGLVLLQGDASQNSVTAADRLLDHDEFRPVLGYLTQRLEPDRVKSEATVIAGYGWPVPGVGEIVLAAVDGDRKTLAVERIATKDLDAALAAGRTFIERHGPPHHDAPTLLARARSEARASGRRVWFVEGGPRCGPCFRLARWMDEHRATLEKDYVLVKVMPGIDDRVEEALAGLPRKLGDGVPWYAITEPDGKVLSTSVGPLGNMGFPTSVEDLRHFRKMFEQTIRKISPGEIDGLIGSLSPK